LAGIFSSSEHREKPPSKTSRHPYKTALRGVRTRVPIST
jgi:hypothetical protein